MGSSPNQQPVDHPHDAESATSAIGRIRSSELLNGRQLLEIEHGGDVYRLRVTRAGKLILTK